jgi:hypothetical protein
MPDPVVSQPGGECSVEGCEGRVREAAAEAIHGAVAPRMSGLSIAPKRYGGSRPRRAKAVDDATQEIVYHDLLWFFWCN